MYQWIVNPIAGHHQGSQVVQQFLDDRPDLKDQCFINYTKYEGHARRLASVISSQNTEILIVVGGDGTLQEVLNRFIDIQNVPIAFIPTGTGNDFARGIGITKRPLAQLNKVFSNSDRIKMKLGVMETECDIIRFTTSAGVGLDADVASVINEQRFSKGRLARIKYTSIYLRTLLKQIIFGKTKNLSLNVDGSCIRMNNTWLVTISILPYFGGGLKIAPEADWSKNDLIITTVEPINRWLLLGLLSTLFFAKHTRLKSVHTYHASAVTLDSEALLTYQVDGSTGRAKWIEIGREIHFTTFLR
ncbi:diacylglycerol/lipid kinase family protein [Alkalibacillus sp. S2W]|uniref:diacylglycerol/lipid kinase family protein n=1 Tax=Alkalibacillus sp. S2W TaxID=3386553 RepID=UPI00398D2D8F